MRLVLLKYTRIKVGKGSVYRTSTAREVSGGYPVGREGDFTL